MSIWPAIIGAAGSFFGGDGVSKPQKQLARQQAEMLGEQWGLARQVAPAMFAAMLQQTQAGSNFLPWLIAEAVNRYTGAPDIQNMIPGLGWNPQVAQPAEAPARAPTMSERVLGTDAAGGLTQPFPGAPGAAAGGVSGPTRRQGRRAAQAAPGDEQIPLPATPALPQPPAFGPTIEPPGFQQERREVERARTDIERAGKTEYGQLYQNIQGKLGSSAAAPGLLAGMGTELASRMYEANLGARMDIAGQQQAMRDQRFQQLAALIGGLQGMGTGQTMGAIQGTATGLGNVAQQWGQIAQQQAAATAQRNQSLGQLAMLFGMGAFGGGGGGAALGGGAPMMMSYSPRYQGNPMFDPREFI